MAGLAGPPSAGLTAPQDRPAARRGEPWRRRARGSPATPRAGWACRGAGPSSRGRAAALGALPQFPAAPSPKMGEEGNKERGSGHGEKRGSPGLCIWVRPVAGRGEGAAIAGELRCGQRWGRQARVAPAQDGGRAREPPAPTRSPSPPRPLPASPRSTHARSSSRLRGSSRIGSQPRGRRRRRRRRGRGERAARPPPPGPSPPPLRSCPAGPEPCLAGGPSPSPSGRGGSSPRPQRPQRRHRNCRFLLLVASPG